MPKDSPLLIAVMGTTASGKTAIAERLACLLDAQLINADAFQIYRGFDIGTAKPSDRSLYRLLDIKDPNESFGVGEWVQAAQIELEQLYDHRRNVIIVGGTGYYIRALMDEWSNLQGPPDPTLREELCEIERSGGAKLLLERLVQIDPKAARELVDPKNPARVRRALERALQPSAKITIKLPRFRKLKIAPNWAPSDLERRIADRTSEMLRSGWPVEVQRLLESGVQTNWPAMRAIGYSDVVQLIRKEQNLEEVEENIRLKTRQYAKRQRTWLRAENELQVIHLDESIDIGSTFLDKKIETLLGGMR